MGFILVVRRPLSDHAIISLLGTTVTSGCIHVVSQLCSVSQLHPTVRLPHLSYADFLFSWQHCVRQEWSFEEEALHHSIALVCIEHIDNVLKGTSLRSYTILQFGARQGLRGYCLRMHLLRRSFLHSERTRSHNTRCTQLLASASLTLGGHCECLPLFV